MGPAASSRKYSPGFTISPSLAAVATALRLCAGYPWPRLFDRIVNRHQLRPIRKRRLHLHLVNHFRDAFHYLFARENLSAETHDFCNAPPVARGFHYLSTQDGHGFYVVEFQSTSLPAPRQIGRERDHQFFLFTRC